MRGFSKIIAVSIVLVFLFGTNVYASHTATSTNFEYSRMKKYFNEIQEALRSNPDLTKFDGNSIEISENRTLILDGDDTGYNIDYYQPQDWKFWTVEDGSYQSNLGDSTLRLYVLGEEKEVISLDFASDDFESTVQVLYMIDEKFLLRSGAKIGVYDLNNKSFSVITEEAVSFKEPVGDELYFTNFDHEEFVCKWTETSDVAKTNQKVVYYWEDSFELDKAEGAQEYFKKIQLSFRDGEKKYRYLLDYDNALNINGHRYGNIHLPCATQSTNYTISICSRIFDYAWLIDDNRFKQYQYGKVIQEISFPENGNWKILDYSTDSNDFLLLNTSTKNVYHLNSNNTFIKLASDVQDYYARGYSIFYWTDSNGNLYKSTWKTNTSNLIAENIVGLTKNYLGFIVKPEDNRATDVYDGLPIFTE